MSQQPPAPPQWSPDRKYWWNGQVWVEASGATPSTPPTSTAAVPAVPPAKRGLRLVPVLVVVVIVLGVCAAVLANQPKAGPKPVIDLNGQMSHAAVVGGQDEIDITVTDTGSIAFSHLVVYLDDKDDWFKHHVITSSSGCTINKPLERLDCGPLAAGESATLTITGSPLDAGNFNFAVSVDDEVNGHLVFPDKDELVWPETITP